jgi:hypothetical protein
MEPRDAPPEAGFDLEVILRQVREAVAAGDGKLAAMTGNSVARAEERRREATAAGRQAGMNVNDRAAATSERKAAAEEARRVRDLGEVHRQVLTLLGEDALRLVRDLPTAPAASDDVPAGAAGTAKAGTEQEGPSRTADRP